MFKIAILMLMCMFSTITRADTIDFSGYTWNVWITEDTTQGMIAKNKSSAWVDEEGKLHLVADAVRAGCLAVEVATVNTFGDGAYSFDVAIPDVVSNWHKNLVLEVSSSDAGDNGEEGAGVRAVRAVATRDRGATLADQTLEVVQLPPEALNVARDLDDAAEIARSMRCCLMCAEKDPRHCHRALISDALLLRGAEVLHLFELNDVRRHIMSEGARLTAEGGVVYDSCVQMGLALHAPD